MMTTCPLCYDGVIINEYGKMETCRQCVGTGEIEETPPVRFSARRIAPTTPPQSLSDIDQIDHMRETGSAELLDENRQLRAENVRLANEALETGMELAEAQNENVKLKALLKKIVNHPSVNPSVDYVGGIANELRYEVSQALGGGDDA